MAQPTSDIAVLPDSTGKEVKEKVVESEGGVVDGAGSKFAGASSSTPFVAGADPHVGKASSTDPQPSGPPSRPSLVPLGSSHAQTSSSTPVAPHPKRFSAVNINKKFLEKNTASGSATTSSSSSITKSGSPAARPTVQPTSSHSRLVTAKLTASPAVSSSTAGWSRPSSVAPSPATVTNSPNSTSPLPTPSALASNAVAPQLPHAGKVIQPQPRAAAAQLGSLQKEASGKPVWGNVKPPTVVPIRPDIEPSDFPTAAEVANVPARKQPKAEDSKGASDTAKHLRSEEADTFRGVHLDPNAHHWDEMEEDNDNFLADVIEFGDGRQYKIESSESQQTDLPSAPVAKEDRFVDDFDRSWPRSRDSPGSASRDFPPASAPSASPNVSPAVSHATHSPQDSSRVLFNERSNRLEPHRPGQGAFVSKRPSYQEGNGSPGEPPRSSRDVGHNVQVLQKPTGNDFSSRTRRFSSSSSGLGSSASAGFIGGHRDREVPNRRDGPPPSPRFSRDQDREFNNDRGRKSTMGPPPLPLHARHPQDGGRQLPPHLSQASPIAPTRRLPSRDSRYPPSEPPLSAGLPPTTSTSAKIIPQSPAMSHESLLSPASTASALPLTAPELDEARKDVMHSAAARAKQRRQEEEQEREAQKERARRKAAELEEKMKAPEAAKVAKEKEAIAVIEEAVKSVENGSALAEDTQAVSARPSLRRPPSLKAIPPVSPSDSPRSAGLRRTGTLPPRTAPPSAGIATPASQSDSWRTRANPLPAPQPPKQIQPRLSTSTNFVASGPSAAEQVETIADGSKDDLEVVDFSDLGKFVGIPEPIQPPKEPVAEVKANTTILSRPSRPVASDFFDEQITMDASIAASKKADFGAWRKRVSQDDSEPTPAPPSGQDTKVDVVNEAEKLEGTTQTSTPAHHHSTSGKDQPLSESSFTLEGMMASTKEPLSYLDGLQGGQTVHVPSHFNNSQRTPRSQTLYKESAMSALDDAMSRIKGVLSGMHPPKEINPSIANEIEVQQPPRVQLGQTPSRSVVKDRWVPPALRVRKCDEGDELQEVFLVTVLEPPLSPPPASGIVVRLPSVSRPVDSVPKRQLLAFSRPPYQARMDILSFDPPVYDMRRDLSLNDVLFRKPPPGAKGKFKYRVFLPRSRGPRVHVPHTGLLAKPNGVGAFGRPTVADGATSWRKPAVSPAAQPSPVPEEPAGLDIMSRSPPPDIKPSDTVVASIPKSTENSPTKSDSSQAARSRSQPKMPQGSAVAFVRDSRIDVVGKDARPLVNFIIGSQLDDSGLAIDPKTPEASKVPLPPAAPKPNLEPSKPVMNGLSNSEDEKERAPLNSSKVDSTDPILVTPPSHHATGSWARSSVSLPVKESPSRAPDRELLKAVWSQPSSKVGIQPVNSLEGIADDLTAFPFTLQDVKSEDGVETPPPTLPSAPSRMSLHDVTRAFQQVPSSSTSQPPHRDRATISPPSTNAPVARPTPTAYTYSPGPQNNMRPAYPSYPSPMMSHSPAPMMYGHPSPVPSQMHAQVNGHGPLYNQPIWMPMPGTTPQPPHANMMRPVASPYPAQMMAYPSPGYAPQHPPPNMMPRTPQGPNAGRGRGMPVMSPVMSHAHAHAHPGAMYSGSPVMMHALPVPQNHIYMPMPAGRGQPPRAENGQLPQHPPPHTNHPQSHPGFNPGPTSQFVRPGW